MNNYDNFNSYESMSYQRDSVTVLQEVTAKTYLYMCFALLISGFFSYVTYTTGNAKEMLLNGTLYALCFVEIGIVLLTSFLIKRDNVYAAAVSGTIYCIINGVTLSVIFLAYEMSSIVSIFFVTAAIFAIMSFYGMVTKKDLTTVGNLALMALLGVIIVSLVNIFIFKSEAADIALSYIGVLIFVVLIAYDTQKIKKLALSNNRMSTHSIALYCALELYLDFINLFLRLLRLFAKRK